MSKYLAMFLRNCRTVSLKKIDTGVKWNSLKISAWPEGQLLETSTASAVQKAFFLQGRR